jgi:hypothetical protein
MKAGFQYFLVFGLLIFLYPLFGPRISFKRTNYLYNLKGQYQDYFEDDYSDADRHEIVDISFLANDPKFKEILDSYIDDELLKICNGKIILGYKKDMIVSVGYPRRFWNWCGTGRPDIVIPIFQKNVDSIQYRFVKINDL